MFHFLIFLLYFILLLPVASIIWVAKMFNTTELLPIFATLFSDLGGADMGYVWGYVYGCFAPTLVASLVLVFIGIKKSKEVARNGSVFKRQFATTVLAFIILVLIVPCVCYLFFSDFNRAIFKSRQPFYDKYYVAPNSVEIRGVKNPPNILVISLESIENLYRDESVYGRSLIPGLSKIADAEENLSFSNYVVNDGQNFTLATFMSTMCGAFFETFNKTYKNLICLSDVLSQKGYRNFYISSCDRNFTGTNSFLVFHNFNKIMDLDFFVKKYGNETLSKKDRKGISDGTLFELTKTELIKLKAESQEPYFVYIPTMDTHTVFNEDSLKYLSCGGNINGFEDVVHCADNVVADFVKWYREFDKNAVIVLIADHKGLGVRILHNSMTRNKNHNLYNAIIGARVGDDVEINRNRSLLAIDWFPTIIEATGMQIDGHRLGLGVSLFDENQQTLIEKLGESSVVNYKID